MPKIVQKRKKHKITPKITVKWDQKKGQPNICQLE